MQQPPAHMMQQQSQAFSPQQLQQPYPQRQMPPPPSSHPSMRPKPSQPAYSQHAPAPLPKQQIASVLNAMTSGGNQHFHAMDGYDLANVHAMNVRYLQQVAAQRSYQQHPHRRPDMAPPSAALFAAKM